MSWSAEDPPSSRTKSDDGRWNPRTPRRRERAMQDFSGRIAVVTGGGTGMGRELCLELARLGANLALCDVSADNMADNPPVWANPEEQHPPFIA